MRVFIEAQQDYCIMTSAPDYDIQWWNVAVDLLLHFRGEIIQIRSEASLNCACTNINT